MQIFSTSMKDKWDNLVYVDLFAGAGRSKIEGLNIIVPGSPLLALSVEHRFAKYIFCEQDPDCLPALAQRVATVCEPEKFTIIQGDVNENVEAVLSAIPKGRKGNTCLSLCLVDPFGISDIKFKTIKQLSSLFMDFFVLVPSSMDGRRNQDQYQDPEDTSLDEFFGNSNWRVEWEKAKSRDFALFILDYFSAKMKELGYLYAGPESSMRVVIEDKNVLLYHLMYFSRDKLGQRFWTDTKKSMNPQLGLGF